MLVIANICVSASESAATEGVDPYPLMGLPRVRSNANISPASESVFLFFLYISHELKARFFTQYRVSILVVSVCLSLIWSV